MAGSVINALGVAQRSYEHRIGLFGLGGIILTFSRLYF